MTNKKSKYQSIVVNKKRYYFYKITWLDIYGDSGHADYGEMMQMQPAKMVTLAYVFLKDKKRLITFASYDTSQESFSDRNVFPIGCILKMEKQNL
jgi:vancomycin permeability regulator SanA|tara:strand:- start:7 stop:291 length:285 start_codon:yes stop_codon:yes gene_type:complete